MKKKDKRSIKDLKVPYVSSHAVAESEEINIRSSSSFRLRNAKSIKSSTSGSRIQLIFDGNNITIQKAYRKMPLIEASNFLTSYDNKVQSKQAQTLLGIIQNLIETSGREDLPEIDIFKIDNNSLGIQWDVGEFRFGASLESNPDDSYWFLTGGKQDRLVRARGFLNNSGLIVYYLKSIIEES